MARRIASVFSFFSLFSLFSLTSIVSGCTIIGGAMGSSVRHETTVQTPRGPVVREEPSAGAILVGSALGLVLDVLAVNAMIHSFEDACTLPDVSC